MGDEGAASQAIRRPEIQRDCRALLRLLVEPEVRNSTSLRRVVVTHVCRLGDPASTDAMLRLAEDDPDRKVRVTAMATLSSSGGRASVPFMLATLRESDDDGMKIHAMGGLARLRPTEAVDPLMAALTETSATVRMAAGEALATIGDPAAIPALDAARRRARNPLVRSVLGIELTRLRAQQSPLD